MVFALTNVFILFQKTNSGDHRLQEHGAESSTDERTLSAEDKGPSYTNIVRNLVTRGNHSMKGFHFTGYAFID